MSVRDAGGRSGPGGAQRVPSATASRYRGHSACRQSRIAFFSGGTRGVVGIVRGLYIGYAIGSCVVLGWALRRFRRRTGRHPVALLRHPSAFEIASVGGLLLFPVIYFVGTYRTWHTDGQLPWVRCVLRIVLGYWQLRYLTEPSSRCGAGLGDSWSCSSA